LRAPPYVGENPYYLYLRASPHVEDKNTTTRHNSNNTIVTIQ